MKTTNEIAALQYPIWNNVSHGPAVESAQVAEESQQPRCWVPIFAAESSEETASRIEAAGWPEVAKYFRGE